MKEPTSTSHRMHIMLVTSSAEARRKVLTFLSSDPVAQQIYQFHEANSLVTAKKMFTSLHPDLVLIILGNSTIPRRDLCRFIRISEGKRHTGIIILSESTVMGDSLVVECLEMGADDFVTANCSPEELKARIRAVLRVKHMTDEMRRLNHRLQILSLTDELTGLSNMRAFSYKFDMLLNDCRAGKNGVGALMLDLDYFKKVNDTSNHLVGSHVIAETGKMLHPGAGLLGGSAIAARYGGDEYVAAMPCTSVEAIKDKAEGIRQAIAAHVFKYGDYTYSITASIGVAWAAPGYSGPNENVIKAADFMLYHSKEMGRNRVSAITLDDESELKGAS